MTSNNKSTSVKKEPSTKVLNFIPKSMLNAVNHLHIEEDDEDEDEEINIHINTNIKTRINTNKDLTINTNKDSTINISYLFPSKQDSSEENSESISIDKKRKSILVIKNDTKPNLIKNDIPKKKVILVVKNNDPPPLPSLPPNIIIHQPPIKLKTQSKLNSAQIVDAVISRFETGIPFPNINDETDDIVTFTESIRSTKPKTKSSRPKTPKPKTRQEYKLQIDKEIKRQKECDDEDERLAILEEKEQLKSDKQRKKKDEEDAIKRDIKIKLTPKLISMQNYKLLFKTE